LLQVSASPIEAFLDYLTVECGLSVNTLEAYQRDLERFSAFVRADGSLARPKDLWWRFAPSFVVT
jgi:site-specific recombinase XerD